MSVAVVQPWNSLCVCEDWIKQFIYFFCCNEFCLWWWRCRLMSEALTDVCGIRAGRDLNTLQRSLIWTQISLPGHTKCAFPWTQYICILQISLMWTEQNCKCVLCKHLRREEGKVEEDYCQNFPHSPFVSIYLFMSAYFKMEVFLFLSFSLPSSSDPLPSYSAYLSVCSGSGEASLLESV